jgi:hypothetical protein
MKTGVPHHLEVVISDNHAFGVTQQSCLQHAVIIGVTAQMQFAGWLNPLALVTQQSGKSLDLLFLKPITPAKAWTPYHFN